MSGRIAISSLAAALLIGTAGIALADNGSPAGTTPAHQMAGVGSWACGSTYSSAAASGPAAGIGVPNDQTGRETSGGISTATAAPSAAASGAAVGTGSPNDLSGNETGTTTAVGRSTPGQPLDEAGLIRMLNDQGYAGVTDVRCHSGAWSFKATQNGSTSLMRLNPKSGTIENE